MQLLTLRDLLGEMLLNSELRSATRVSYRVETQRAGALLDREAATITAPEIERWAGSSQPRRRTVRVLKTIFNWAVRNGHLAVNPIAVCSGPRLNSRAHLPGIQRLLQVPAHLPKLRDRALVTLLLDTGLRLGEALALDWQHVDLEALTVLVERSVGKGNKLQPMKTRNAEREIIISEQSASLLRQIMPTLHENCPVFRNRWGTRLDAHNWHARTWRPLMRKLGMSFRIHDLRHACATLLLEAGVPMTAVQQRLGHTTIATTMQFYARRSRVLSRQAAQAMDAVLKGSPAPLLQEASA